VDGGSAIGNHIYKYDWIDEKLVNPIIVTKLPSNALWEQRISET
jgi:hypothetical protein